MVTRIGLCLIFIFSVGSVHVFVSLFAWWERADLFTHNNVRWNMWRIVAEEYNLYLLHLHVWGLEVCVGIKVL